MFLILSQTGTSLWGTVGNTVLLNEWRLVKDLVLRTSLVCWCSPFRSLLSATNYHLFDSTSSWAALPMAKVDVIAQRSSYCSY
ncbi:hypothetical protein CW304_20845 [Bacillus sp. UFRGS-B20]|nr:hypothetical protein CW304_20845 [Bacillus sp. UFRGS-B20]